MRTLIAGATGYLGGRLARRLASRGHVVVLGGRNDQRLADAQRRIGPAARTLRLDADETELVAHIRRLSVDTLILAVCDYGRGGESDLQQANYDLPCRLTRAAAAAGVDRVVHAGSSLPADVSPYAATKTAFSDFLLGYDAVRQRFDARIEQFYGPGQQSNQFIAWLIEQLSVPGDALPLTAGEQSRDLLYIDDLVDALVALAEYDEPAPVARAVPVGSGTTYLMRDVVRTICDLCGGDPARLKFGVRPYRDNELMFSRADVSYLYTLQWRPMTDLHSGLAQCVAAFNSQRNIAA